MHIIKPTCRCVCTSILFKPTDLLMHLLVCGSWTGLERPRSWASRSLSRTEYWPADAATPRIVLSSDLLMQPLPASYWLLTCWCICSCAYPWLVQHVPEAGPSAPRVVLGGAAEVIRPAHHTAKKIGQSCRILRFDNVCYPSFCSIQGAMFRMSVSVNVNFFKYTNWYLHAH